MFCRLTVLLPLILLAGCTGSEDPVEARLKEVGYTPERIAAELESRLNAMGKAPARRTAGKAGEEDASRGDGPGGGRNPFTFDAILTDINQKIVDLQAKSDDVDVREQVIEEFEKRTLNDSAVKEKALEALRAK